MKACAFHICLLICLVSFNLSFPDRAEGSETVISSIVLNGEDKGYFFVVIIEGKGLYLRLKDIKALGLNIGPGIEPVEIEGEKRLRLDSIGDMEYAFDKDALTLSIKAGPGHLSRTVKDLGPERPGAVHPEERESAYLNYKLDYVAGDNLDLRQFSLTNELGARIGEVFFRTDSYYMKTASDGRFVRLSTNLIYDDRQRMSRAVLGDLFTPPAEFGSGMAMGGVSYSKMYRMDPYFVRQPMFGFSGFVGRASEVEVYLDGVPVMKEKVPAGAFELKNIYSRGGPSEVEVVVREPFSEERRIREPLYFTDSALRKGLHEYSYNAGFVREKYGAESGSYGEFAIAGFHRHSFSDYLTAGLWGEATLRSYNLGPQLQYHTRGAGLINVTMANSMDRDGNTGFAGSFAHTYQSQKISARLLLRGYTRDYTPVVDRGEVAAKYELGMGLGYGTRAMGSVSLDYAAIGRRMGAAKNMVSATYSKGLRRDVNLFVTLRDIREGGAVNDEVFMGLSYYPWEETFVSANYLRNDDVDVKTLNVQKNPPFGEGYGYRVMLSSETSEAGTVNTLNPSVRYNTRRAIFTGEYRARHGEDATAETYEATASGAVTFIEGGLRLSRPIAEGFGLVRTGGLKGVRVYQNNQELGRTDDSGEMLIPDITPYFSNRISIDYRDIPMGYMISDAARDISPSWGSGSVIDFRADGVLAIAGIMKIKDGDKYWSAEYGEIIVVKDNGEDTFPIGTGGEFYIEGLSPGDYDASVRFKDKSCRFRLVVPESRDMITDLGELYCEDVD